MSTLWVSRFRYEMSRNPAKPGIWRLKNGGYFVRAKYGKRALPDASLAEAIAVRQALSEPQKVSTKPTFAEFATSLFEERILSGDIESKASRERWGQTLTHYLVPAFGQFRVNELELEQIILWKREVGRWILSGKPSLKNPKKNVNLSPSTANGWLRILRTICNRMTIVHRLPFNPFQGVTFFAERPTYTPENPNSLSPKQARLFLELAKKKYPQHFVMMLLGFVTGLRPSSLRPLRPTIDVLWATGQLLIRRSNSRGAEIMERTKTSKKTGKTQTINLPEDIVTMLKEHVKTLPKGSTFLFPNEDGGMRSRSVLDKPFAAIVKAMKLPFKVTPRAMRRTFQDLARSAEVSSLVKRSISGHSTVEMEEHYSTVLPEEQREAVGAVLRLVK